MVCAAGVAWWAEAVATGMTGAVAGVVPPPRPSIRATVAPAPTTRPAEARRAVRPVEVVVIVVSFWSGEGVSLDASTLCRPGLPHRRSIGPPVG